MDSPIVSIIIVNWNGRYLLPDSLGSLAKINYKNTEIFFVDNASKDGSVAYVKKHYPKIKIMQNKINLGYAEGHEKAFKKAKGELILLLNPDTIVERNLLTELIKAINSNEKIGAVMPKILMYPQKHLIDSIGAFFLTTGFLYHFGREKDLRDSKYNLPMEVYSGKGACLLFKKSVLQKTGLFDKDYFAYFEETDLCHRVWLSGHSVLYWPYTVVYHKEGSTSKKMIRSFIYFHSFKNRILTYLKNLSVKNLFFVLPQLFVIYQCAFFLYLLRGNFGVAWTVQRSIVWNFINLKQTLKKRWYVQNKIRTISDEDFLPKITKSVRLSYYYYLFRGLGFYND